MAGNTYMTKGYSPYTNIPARQGDLDYGQKNPVSPYDFETKTKKQSPISTLGYNFSGSRTKFELLKEYVYGPNMAAGSKYAPMSHYQGYLPNYGINYEISSPYMKPNYASNPNEHLLSRPVHGYPSEESRSVHSGHDLAKVSPIKTRSVHSGHDLAKVSPVKTPSVHSGHDLARVSPVKTPSVHSGHDLARVSPVRTQNIASPDKPVQGLGPPARPNPLTTLTTNISDNTAPWPLYTRLQLAPSPNSIGHNFTNT